MNKDNWIKGAGGGDSNEPTRTPDNLLSQDYFEVVLAISEGPIKGIVSENPAEPTLENFYAGETPAYSLATDTANFSDFSATGYVGLDTDPAVRLNLGGLSSNLQVNVSLSTGIPVIRQTPSTARNNFDAIEIRVLFSQLVRTTNEGTFENTAHLRISYKAASSATWLDYNGETDTSVTGKTSQGYVKEFVIDVPRIAEDYDLRLIKLSPDGTPGVDENIAEFSWESVQMVKRGEVQFADLAFMHIYGKASNQFNSVPEFSGVFDGLVVKVPTNYNPESRTYDETTPWNGTFKDAYTNCGPWILYDLITNPRYGLVSYYKSVTANRYEFYEEAKWCDELVPDGRGGYQPRFTFNELISEAKSGLELLRYVAGAFNAVIYDDGNGAICLRSDRPRAARQIFTPENVSTEGFSYTFTDISTRFNEITATFNNPELDWDQDRRSATISNVSALAKNGRIPLDFVAVGCTDAHEAVRRANYRYITANQEVTNVNFLTSRLGLTVDLMETIYVADPEADWSVPGRIKSVVGSTIHLRDPIYFGDSDPRTMQVQTFDGLVPITVAPPAVGAVYSLTITAGTFPSNVPDRTVFTIEDAGNMGLAKPFRVLALEEVDGSPDKVRVAALEIATNKYPDADAGATSSPVQYAYTQPGESLLPATMELDSLPPIINADGSIIYQAQVSWVRPVGANSSRYEIDFRLVDDATWTTRVARGDREVLSPLSEGKQYVVRLYAVNPAGQRSQKCLQGTVTVLGKGGTLQNVTGLAVVATTAGWEINWGQPVDLPDYAGTEFRIGPTSTTDYDSLPIRYKRDTGPQPMPWLPAGVHRIMAKYTDTSGNYSADFSYVDLTVLVPLTPILTINRGFDSTKILFQDCTTSQPLKDVQVRQGTPSNTFDTAEDSGSAGANQRMVVIQPSALEVTHVFLRARDVANNVSNVVMEVIPPAAGSVAELIDLIETGITEDYLSPTLLSEIALISAADTVAGSVAARVKAEADARSAAVALEASNRAAALLNPALNPAIDSASSAGLAAANAANIANLKSRHFYSATAPVSGPGYTLAINDGWTDTDDQNKVYRWSGAAWELTSDARISQAVTDIAQETTNRIDGDTAEVRIRESLYAATAGSGPYKVFNQATAPLGLVAADVGAVWSWKTATVETFSRWSGTAWVTSVSNQRAAVYRGAYTTLPTTGNVIGDTARNSTTNAVLVWNGSTWVTKTNTEPGTAFLEQEAFTRATDIATEAGLRSTLRTDFDTAEGVLTAAIEDVADAVTTGDAAVASTVTTLATQMRGTYNGNNLSELTEGLFYQEREARTNADESLSQQITLLSAGASDAFDYFTIWYFDTTVEGWSTATSGVTLSNNAGWLKLISNSGTVSGPWVQSPDGLSIDATKYPQVRARIRKYGTPTWEGKVYFRTVAADSIDEARSMVIDEPSFDTNGISLVTWNMPATWVGTIKRVRFDLATEVTTTDYYEIDWVAVGRASPGASSAQILLEQTARVESDLALASDISDLDALITDPVTGLTATADALDVVEAAVTNGTTGLVATANRTTTLESRVNTPSATPGNPAYNPTYASLVNAYSTTSSMNAAISSAVNAVISNLNASGGSVYTSIAETRTIAQSKSANYTGPTAPSSPALNDTWIDSSNGRILKTWNGSAWVASDDTRIGTQASQISVLQSTVSSGGANLIKNSSFEIYTGTSGVADDWIAYQAGTTGVIARALDASKFIHGARSQRITATTLGTTSTDRIGVRQDVLVPTVAAGTLMTFSGSVSGTVGARAYLYGAYVNSAGAGLGVPFTRVATCTGPDNFQRLSFSSAVPAGAVKVNCYMWLDSNPTVGPAEINVDAMQLQVGELTAYDAPQSSAAIQQEASTRATETGYLGAQWAMKVALINSGGTAEIGGIAIAGTSSGNAGARFDMSFRSNAFFFLPPAGQSNVAYSPLVFYPSQTVVNGVTVPAGLYVKSAFIDYITASRIDTRGLEVKDALGNVILSSGTALDFSRINPSTTWLNSNVGAVNMVWGAGNGAFSAGTGLYGVTVFDLKTATSNPYDLRPGEVLTISADVWRDSTAATAGQTATLYLHTRNAAGTWTKSVSLIGSLQVPERQSATLTLPTVAGDITTVSVALYHQSGGAGGNSTSVGTVNCDRTQVERGSSATQYAKGVEPGATVGAPAGTFVAGTAAATVVTNANNGANAWSKFSGAGATLPAGNVEFNFASSTSKGGFATNTLAVGTQSAAAVQATTVNFNSRNDRNSAAVVAPTMSNVVGTIDHTANSDGSVNISLDWSWAGAEADIDGFILYVYDHGTVAPTSRRVFTGLASPDEAVYYVTPKRRSFIMYGMGADRYYTLGVQAYRVVDQDVVAGGSVLSTIAQPLATAVETTNGAYRASANVAFSGDITGTVAGVAASTLVSTANTAKTTADNAKTTADNAALAALAAQQDADSAAAKIADIESDGKFTPSEKQERRKEWDALYAERAIIRAQADSFSITTEKTNYDNAFQALGQYLNAGAAYSVGATPPTWLLDTQLSNTVNITGSAFRTNWTNLYSARQSLLNKVATLAATKADWASIAARPSDTDLLNKEAAFQASVAWTFNGSAEGWTWDGMSGVTANPTAFLLASAGTNPVFYSPGISISGARNKFVRARIRRLSGGFSSWDGACYYTTGSHGHSNSFRKNISNPTVIAGEWYVAEWDMSALTVGGADWTSNTITQIRLDFGASNGDTYEVDWVAIGDLAPASYGAPTGSPVGSTTADVVAAAVAAVNDGSTGLAQRLRKSGADTMVGPISLAASTAILVGTTNDGLYLGNTGLVGRKAAVTTFSISAAGDATFAGAITGGTMNINNRFIVNSAGQVTMSSAASGARMEITNQVLKVFDESGNLRVRIGNLSA